MSDESVDGGANGRRRAVAVRFAQALLVVVAALVAGSALIPLAEEGARALGVPADSPELVVVETVGQFVGFGLAAAVFLLSAGDRDLLRVRRPSAGDLGWSVAGAAVLLVGQYAILLALASVGVQVAENRALTPGEGAPRYFLYMVVVSILVVGPGEELVFRGVAQGELRRALGAPAAIGVASALFGLVHFAAGTGTVVQQAAYVVVALLLGSVLGYLYETRATLVVPALAHGLYNAVLYAVRYAGETGVL